MYDWNKKGSHVLIGSVDVTVSEILSVSGDQVHSLQGNNGKILGSLVIHSAGLERHPTFLGYMRGGCEMSFVVGIDFTSANGDPSKSDSYHHWDSTGQTSNQYEQIIRVAGEIIEKYDTDRRFPVFGFGAKARGPSGHLSATQHWFPLDSSGDSACGVSGILSAYRQVVPSLVFDGPCRLAPIIQYWTHLLNHSESHMCSQEHLRYTILMLITCGGVSDMEETISAIVDASHCPLSIIIVGVGGADFEGIACAIGCEFLMI